MKKIVCCILVLLIVMLPVKETNVALAETNQIYHWDGNYDSSAPIKPTTGLGFYVDYTAISKYGSAPFSVAFDWNGNYTPCVAAVAQYPLSATAYPTYFPICIENNLAYNVQGETFFYDSQGRCLNDYMSNPMNETNIYRCSIGLPNDATRFNNDYVSNEVYLKKVIAHEVGHVFLLKHPTMNALSVMHEGPPYQYKTSTVTATDRENIVAKWGN